ncbi:MAG: hypothetical protein J6Y82_12870 [Bacteroidales bacterium]|nr:hypothetical protein [Bacteroidales bacterium]
MRLSFLTLLSALSVAQISVAQASADDNSGWDYKISGFIDPQIHYDTREIVGGREEQMLFYPAPKVLDADGNDINASGSINMLTITARAGAKITAPDMLGAKVFGYLEGDFTGSTNEGINMLRLRHAYINMRWAKSGLLLGQYWHPMVAHEVMPGTRPLNMGIPFHPYSRYVQGKYTYYAGKVELSGIASFQLDNKSVGPKGGSTEYQRNSGVPELNAQLVYRGDVAYLGAMFNYVVLKPRTFTVDALGNKHKTDVLYGSSAFSVFGKFTFDEWNVRFQAIYGNNLYEQCLMGGYIESGLKSNNEYDYDDFGTTTFWIDMSKNKGLCRPGIFAGFGKNNQFGDKISSAATVYGRGIDIENVWRIQPRLAFFPNKTLNFFAEWEYTVANYGKQEAHGDYYKYVSDYSVANSRFIAAAVFNF